MTSMLSHRHRKLPSSHRTRGGLPSISDTGSSVRVTTSGNASLFHGVPDWVYEEEVFSADYALWWAPDASKVAFLRFDETAVDEYTFPVYNPTENANTVVPYPETVVMKYPKPGYNNPLVSVHVFQLDEYLEVMGELGSGANRTTVAQGATLELRWDGRQAPTNSIISEVAWVSNSSLLVREVTRAAENGSVVYFDLGSTPANVGSIVRKLGKEGEQGDDGWIDAVCLFQPICSEDTHPAPAGPSHPSAFSVALA